MTSTSSVVVSLDTYRTRPAHSAIARMEEYWNNLRGDRLVPSRAEVDPRGMSDILEHAFVLERVARGLARFRVAGTHINGLMGTEVRGMPLTAMMRAEARDPLTDALEAVFDEPAIVRMTLTSSAGLGRPELTAQLLLLPLRSDFGEVNRAMGALVSDREPGRVPRRFGVADEQRRTLVGYADGQRGLTPPPSTAQSRSTAHLTVVSSDA